MKPFRSFIPPLAAMLMAASGGTSAQGVLIDKSEIRFVSKQMGVSVEGRFRKWKANVDFRPTELGKSKASFEIELASIDLASEESESEIRRPVRFDVTHVECGPGPAEGRAGCGAHATGRVSRRAFGMSFAYPLVGDEVALVFAVTGIRIGDDVEAERR